MRLRRAKLVLLLLRPSGAAASIAAGTLSAFGTTITIPATLGVDNSGGVYGVEYQILDNGGSLTGYTLAKNVVGAGIGANTLDLVAADGVTADSTVTIRSYYNLDPLDLDPADRVYAYYAPYVVAAGAPTGTTTVGSTLTRAAQGIIAGSSPITVTRQWQNDQNTGTWIDITGETAATYVLVAGDENDDIAVLDTASNSQGSDSERSTAVGPIAVGGPAFADVVLQWANDSAADGTAISGRTASDQASSPNAFTGTNTYNANTAPSGMTTSIKTANGTQFSAAVAGYALGTAEFCVDIAVHPITLPDTRDVLVQMNGTGLGIQVNASGQVLVNVNGSTIITSVATLSLNTWYLVRVAKVGTTISLYVDANGGSFGATGTGTPVTNTTNLTTTQYAVGHASDGSGKFQGHIASLRIIPGFGTAADDTLPFATS